MNKAPKKYLRRVMLSVLNSSFTIFLLIWVAFVTYLIFDRVASKSCPYEWGGGSITHKGSCWCGKYDLNCACTPSIAIDAIIELSQGNEVSIVLVRRKQPPRKYAIPGGFVDVGETTENATIREVYEETKLEISSLEFFGVYSDPLRDVRRHTVSIVYRCIIASSAKPKAGDDAKAVEIIPLHNINSLDIAFDHKRILQDYINKYHPQFATRNDSVVNSQPHNIRIHHQDFSSIKY